jgi:site-specific DNA recombinase
MMAMKVAAYIRVSTEDQAREGVSLEAQAERLRAYCVAKDWTLTVLEADEGLSAKTLDRPGMGRVLARVESRQVDVVLVYKLDRLTRSVADLARLVELFERRGVALVSLVESLDATTATGRLMMNLLASVSQWEREVIGERTQEAMSYKKQHRQVYSPVPYGFAREGTALVEDEAEMRIVRQMREWRGQGWTLTAIADTLNKQGVPTKRGGRWAAATVWYMLKNSLYGELVA